MPALLTHMVAMAVRTNLSKPDLLLITNWMGVTDYVMPGERKLNNELASAILEHCRPRISMNSKVFGNNYLFDAWYHSAVAQDMLTQREQIFCAEILTKGLT